MADSKFLNRPIAFESSRIGTANSNLNRISKLRRSLFRKAYFGFMYNADDVI